LEERKAFEAGEEWRSPDRLLKGFRNRNIHGLLDCELGLDVLRCLRDSSHAPGANGEFPKWTRQLAEDYCKAFAGSDLVTSNDVSGWKSGKTFVGITHPLWTDDAGSLNGVGAIHALAAHHGCSSVCLVDAFNLSRRMGWVRSRLLEGKEFPILPVNASLAGTDAPAMRPMETDLDTQAIMALPEGRLFDWGGMSWEKCNPSGIASVSSERGSWLAVQTNLPDAFRLQITVSGPVKRFKRIGYDTELRKLADAEDFPITLVAKKKQGGG
jgi:hypothetical protein